MKQRTETLHITKNGDMFGWEGGVDAPQRTVTTLKVSPIMIDNLKYMVQENVQSLLKHLYENPHILNK